MSRVLRNEARVLEWVNAGCAVQVTASALTGRWGEPARAFARSLLEKDAVHVLATDAHDSETPPAKAISAREIVADRMETTLRKLWLNTIPEPSLRDSD
jgi:protein-tyrosine phosphatase